MATLLLKRVSRAEEVVALGQRRVRHDVVASSARRRRGAIHEPSQRAAERRRQPVPAAGGAATRRDRLVVRLSQTDLPHDADQQVVDFVVEQRRDLHELTVTLRRRPYAF